jgi:hypothetical protein
LSSINGDQIFQLRGNIGRILLGYWYTWGIQLGL